MTPIRSRFKSFGRAALVALALGGAGALAAPVQAQAQSAPSFNFQLDFGSGGAQFGIQGGQAQRGGQHWDRGERWRRCLTDREIVRGLEGYGFWGVQIGRSLGRDRVSVEAVYGNWVYSMRVDRCTGQVDRVQREYRHQRPSRPGFNFQFDFR